MPGQERDVGDLLGRLIAADLIDHLLVGVDQSVDPHARLVALGNPPGRCVDLFQRPVKRALAMILFL